jgi:pyridoxamine 5'-phosphate oxidase family protein
MTPAVTFTDAEAEFIKAHPIGRLATASPSGEPDVAPVLCVFRRSLGVFVMGSRQAERTRRHHNARRNPRASLVFDDLTWEPYQPRGVKLTGSIAVHIADEAINLGTIGSPVLVVRPERKWSWGIEAPAIDGVGRFSVQRPDGTTATL